MNMRVPLSWLKEHIDIKVSPEELGHTLTMAGLEVESIERIGSEWGDKIITAQIVHLEKVEGSDHLNYTRINTGNQELNVICGAPNIAVNDKVPLALPGARIGELTIGETKKFGYVSQGMLCSPRELGLGNDHSGIYILEPDTPLNVPLAELFSETVLEFSIKAHRGDLSSIIGIAREVSALTGEPLKIPHPIVHEKGMPAAEMIKIRVEDPKLCPRYSARIIGDIKIGPSPNWMGRRLLAAGMRPINNIVDITNYVMLEFGQPLHGFDYDLIRQKEIIVRPAYEGEVMKTLDGVKRKLKTDTLLIADPKGPTAIAGVMGGAISEVNDNTTTVLLESANFDAGSVRRTSVALGLRSDASSRFEKGLDPELTVVGANRAAQLMEELAGAVVQPGIVDFYPEPLKSRTLPFSTAEVEWLTAVKPSTQEATKALEALGFQVTVVDEQSGKMQVTIPTYRRDIEEGADLVEEVIRLIGYDRIPRTIPAGPLPEPSKDHWFEREYDVREILTGASLNEVVSYALTSRARMAKLLPYPSKEAALALLRWEGAEVSSNADGDFDARSLPAVTLVNPLTIELESLRVTLMSSMLEIVQENYKRTHEDLRFFEVGRRYLPAQQVHEQPDERRTVGIALCGPASVSWHPELAREADFFDLKGVVETLVDRLHIKRYRITPTQHPTFHPGRCARLEVARPDEESFHTVGVLGEVHPQVQQRYDLPSRVYLAELDLETLYAAVPERLVYEPISRQQELTRDLAVIVDQQVPAQAVQDVIVESGGPLLHAAKLFDVYTGDPIPAGKKNLTYSLVYLAQDRTLTDAEANSLQDKILQALQERFEAVLR